MLKCFKAFPSSPSSLILIPAVACLSFCCQVIPPSDAKVFQDYVLPSLSLLPNDPEESVRVEYAAGITRLAAAAHLHLMRLQHASNLQQAAVTQRAADAANTAAVLAAAAKSVSEAEGACMYLCLALTLSVLTPCTPCKGSGAIICTLRPLGIPFMRLRLCGRHPPSVPRSRAVWAYRSSLLKPIHKVVAAMYLLT